MVNNRFHYKMQVKQLEQRHREEREHQIECIFSSNPNLNSIDALRTATPADGRASSRDETMSDIDPQILRCSNSINGQVVGHSSALLKGRESLHEIKRKRESENSFGMHITSADKKMMVPTESSRGRKIDQTKALGRLTRVSKGGGVASQKPQVGVKEKDRIRGWVR